MVAEAPNHAAIFLLKFHSVIPILARSNGTRNARNRTGDYDKQPAPSVTSGGTQNKQFCARWREPATSGLAAEQLAYPGAH